MTAAEWGRIEPAAPDVAGDATYPGGWTRTFVTSSAAGVPVVLEVSAVPALIDSGADPADPHAARDLLEVTNVHTYLEGADLGDGDPFDTETTYTWPIDYWPESARRRDGEPTLRALRAAARRHLETLPAAWLDAMPDPPAGLLLHGEPFLA
jgi:hypothetical protein